MPNSAEEIRHAAYLADRVAWFRSVGMVLKANDLQAELDRHLAATEPPPFP